MKPQTDIRARGGRAGPVPGTEPKALWIITAAALAGLVITVFAVMPPGASSEPTGFAAAGHGRQPRPDGTGTPPPPRGSAQEAGVRLLDRAARACRLVSYQAVEELTWRNPAGPGVSAVEIWHVRGGQALMKSIGGDSDAVSAVRRVMVPWGAVSTPVLEGTQLPGVSQRVVSLIDAHYRLAVTGTGWVVGRRAVVVTARRAGGGLAARFWLDMRSKLPLRRQTFDVGGRTISDATFVELTLGHPARAERPGAVARSWGAFLPRAQLARLRALGWPLPASMPGDLALLAARRSSTAAGPVIDLDYTDGLAEISLVVQRGHLPPGLGGWSQATVGGQRVYTDASADRSLAWSANGFVYLVIAAAPQQTVAQVVATLPHAAEPGLPSRIGRGLRRLFSLLGL
jgi:sigma-E factor negative regulatory protein RseB